MELLTGIIDILAAFGTSPVRFILLSVFWVGLFTIARSGWKKRLDLLKQSEEKYKKLHESIRDGVVSIDMNGAITGSNSVLQKMLGYTKDELNLLNFRDITPKKWLAAEEGVISRQLDEKGYTDPYEKEYQRKDGSICPVEISVFPLKDENDKLYSMWGIIRDISERKKMEESIRESMEKFKIVADYTYDWEYWEDKDFRIIYTSPSCERITGYSVKEFLLDSSLLFKIIHPDDSELFSDHMNSIHQVYSQHKEEEIDFKIIKKDGTVAYIGHLCRSIFDNHDNYLGRRISNRDITERNRKDQKIKSLLAEKELLLKEVHHRIKNNMNTISSLLSLQSHTVKEPSAITALEDATSRVHSMSILYDKLYRSPDFTDLSVKHYLPALIDEIIGNFPNNQIVKTEKHIDDFSLDAKQLQPLGIIINELLTNIMKYAFLGRTEGNIIVSATNANRHITVTIQDNGDGIPESFSFENPTGFGLQLVHALTQQLDGTIKIERGDGTKVALEFEI